MKLRHAAFLAVVALTGGLVVLACGDDAGSVFDGGDGSDAGSDAAFPPPIGIGDGGATGPASGVVLVHAAGFPAFRLCFEEYPDLVPQPDARVLPQANVVGVEMGSVVRIGAITKRPGKVYLIDQAEAVASPKDPMEKTCRELLTKLQIGKDYEVLGSIEAPLGTDSTAVLAVTGCGRSAWLQNLGIAENDCGDYNAGTGNLKIVTFPLASTTQTTPTTLPVALVSLAPSLVQLAPPDTYVDVTFGDFDAGKGAPLAQQVARLPALDASAAAVLELPLGQESVYGTHGFRIAYRSDAGEAGAPDAAAPYTFDQTLAEVQAISRPDSNPTTYFLGPSNYALLLIGDPRIRRAFEDGGANPAFDARRALHFLAVPVREDSDAGPLGGIGASTP